MSRNIVLAVNWTRPAAVTAANKLATLLSAATIDCYAVNESETIPVGEYQIVSEDQLPPIEAILVIGGDGTILRSAELARKFDVPLLGINHGHVGFLAEAESSEIEVIAQRIIQREWQTENRLTLQVKVFFEDKELWQSWALNEISIEKASTSRIVELVTAVDDRPVSRYAGDGVIVATPTGSTAYAFSAGGPVVWPNVSAVVLVPLSAHSLFARPLVISPTSSVTIDLISEASAWADSRRGGDIPAGARIVIEQSSQPIKLMRLDDAPFTDRLVAKFSLPTSGWRGNIIDHN